MDTSKSITSRERIWLYSGPASTGRGAHVGSVQNSGRASASSSSARAGGGAGTPAPAPALASSMRSSSNAWSSPRSALTTAWIVSGRVRRYRCTGGSTCDRITPEVSTRRSAYTMLT